MTHTPTFTLDGDTIKFKKGAVGKIHKNDNGYAVHLIADTHNLDPVKAQSLEKRMRDWYYFTQIKK